MSRFAVIRVPGSGPPALVGAPYHFDTEHAALARIAEIEAAHLKSHHTHLEVVPFEGPLHAAMQAMGINI